MTAPFVPESAPMAVLSKTENSLSAVRYFDADHYAQELAAIWYRDWVCVGRQEEIATAGDYFTVDIGSQRLIVTRDDVGEVRAFHNTCRHRGSTLCTVSRGRFRNRRIICPYHTWTYDLHGNLIATPGRIASKDFDEGDYPLYAVHTASWGGYIFVNLSDGPTSQLADFLGPEASLLDRWPLCDMVSVQQDRRVLACNWKIFWENYSECYHCPRVHPELCKLVPVYQSGVLNNADIPDWQPEQYGDDGRPRVAPGFATWTLDGKSLLPNFKNLGDADVAAGVTFASFTASMFVVAHPDYVRSVRMLPRGPESVELFVDWLMLPDTANVHAAEFEQVFALGRLLVEQDGKVCELNQMGLRSIRHHHGVLVPQEHSVHEFHQWLESRLVPNRMEHG